MGRYIITGTAGFIGSHLADRLLTDGHDVVGIDSFEDYYPRAFKEANVLQARDHASFTLIEANLVGLASESAEGNAAQTRLAELFRGADCVYHLAAQAGVRASWGSDFRVYTDNNVLGTQVVLEACRAAEVPRVVYASSSSVYGNHCSLPLREDADCRPHSPYGVTKLAGEGLCKLYTDNFGLHTVSLRFFTVYGPRQRPDMAFNRFIRAALEDRPIVINGDGEQTRDFTYVDDIIAGIVVAHRAAPGTVANLGGGQRVSLMATVATLEDVMGRKMHVEMRLAEAGDVRDTWADLAAASAAFEWAPAVGLADGLAAEWRWLANGRASVVGEWQ